MKRIGVVVLLTLILLLSGCAQSKDLKELKRDILENNVKTELVLKSYDSSKHAIDNTEATFISSLFGENTDNGEVLEPYLSTNRNVGNLIKSINNILVSQVELGITKGTVVTLDDFREGVTSYSLLDGDTGDINQLIIIPMYSETIYLTVSWEEAKIVRFDYIVE